MTEYFVIRRIENSEMPYDSSRHWTTSNHWTTQLRYAEEFSTYQEAQNKLIEVGQRGSAFLRYQIEKYFKV